MITNHKGTSKMEKIDKDYKQQNWKVKLNFSKRLTFYNLLQMSVVNCCICKAKTLNSTATCALQLRKKIGILFFSGAITGSPRSLYEPHKEYNMASN